MNYKALAIAASLAIGGFAIAPEVKASTSADYWSRMYTGAFLNRTYKYCQRGQRVNATGDSYYRFSHEITQEEVRDFPGEANVIRAQTAGKHIAMQQVCSNVW